MLCNSVSLRRLASIDLGHEALPDATNPLLFRHLPGRHKLVVRLFWEAGRVPQANGMTLKTATVTR